MNHFFKHDCSTCQVYVCLDTPPQSTGHLFGNSFMEECEARNPPTTVLVSFVMYFCGCPEQRCIRVLFAQIHGAHF